MSVVELSIKQKEIVNFSNGSILVRASAGSGKTRVLTERIKRLLPTTKRKILAITFTNKAGEEMLNRLEGIEELNSRIFIGTFHGFCQKILQNHGSLIGLTTLPHIFEDDSDRLQLLEEAILEIPYFESLFRSKSPKDKRTYLYDVLRYISEIKRNLHSADSALNEGDDEDSALLYKSYQERLDSLNGIDFDDLLLLTYNLLSSHENICSLYRRTYEYICIDEAQDLNFAQYQLIKVLAGDVHNNIMMVGDPNQSIFAFNGSSADFMNINFINDYEPHVINLSENYRSAIRVLKAAERIIAGTTDLTNTVKEGKFEIAKSGDELLEAKSITQKIKELIVSKTHTDIEGEITYEKIAILARNKYVFNSLETEFRENEIPFYYKSTPGAIKYESSLLSIFDLALKVKINSQDSLHFQRLKVLLNDKKSNSLEELANSASPPQNKVITDVLNLLEDGSNFKSALKSIQEVVTSSEEIHNDNEKLMIYNDIEELNEHWYNYATKTEKPTLGNFKNSMALGQTHSLTQKDGVTLSTVHTMKGQEYDIIFIMGCDDETFPDYRAISKKGVHLKQEQNNMYVAFTRAKRFLFVSYPSQRTMPWGDVKKRRKSRFFGNFEIENTKV